MIYNIYGFISYARYIRGLKSWDKDDKSLYLPIVLLIFFLIGYIVVGTFGDPDIMMAGILFGGSIFGMTVSEAFAAFWPAILLFNLIKTVAVGIVTMLLYKRLSDFIKKKKI